MIILIDGGCWWFVFNKRWADEVLRPKSMMGLSIGCILDPWTLSLNWILKGSVLRSMVLSSWLIGDPENHYIGIHILQMIMSYFTNALQEKVWWIRKQELWDLCRNSIKSKGGSNTGNSRGFLSRQTQIVWNGKCHSPFEGVMCDLAAIDTRY